MAKKGRTKGKDEEKPGKGGGSKPIKVVTFDTSKTGSFEQRRPNDWKESEMSNPAAWGETAVDGDWSQSSSAANWSNPTLQPLPILSEAYSPFSTSPQRSRPLSVSTDPLVTTVNDKAILDSPYDDFQKSHPDHNFGSLPSDATSRIVPTSPSQTSIYVDPQSLTFTAAGVTMQKSKPQAPIQAQKYTSASEQARKNMKISTTSQSRPPPVPLKPLEPTFPASVTSKSTLTAQQWKTWTKGTPTSAHTSHHRFGSRDDYAVVAAAIERDVRKAAAAGNYPLQTRWPDSFQSGGYAGPPKASGSSHQGGSIGWPQPGTSGWMIPQSSNVDLDHKLKRKSDFNSSSRHQQFHRHQIHAQSNQYHEPTSKNWQDWAGGQGEETNSDDEWNNQDDWYADGHSEGWRGHGDSGWGEKGGDGWESGWDDKSSGIQKGKSSWGGRAEGGSWDTRPKGSEWDGKPKGGRWGDKSGETFQGRGKGGTTLNADQWVADSSGWDHQETDNWGINRGTWGGSEVITDPPENFTVREALSPLQRSQILNEWLKHEQRHKTQGTSSRYPHGVTLTDNPVPHKSHELESSWGQQDGWGPIQEVDEEDKSNNDDEKPKHDPWGYKIDDTAYSMPSKTLAYAYQDAAISLHQEKPRNSMNDYISTDFVESHGRALKPVEQALFGKARWAKDRIYWMFPPEKDERVSQLLSWIEKPSRQLGTFGLQKFLQSRERGALIVNAGFRLPGFPNQPVFDWLTFDQLQATMDKTMQESVVFYDPATQVIVFVLLPSKSGNSVAMWRRKIQVPNDTRLIYEQYITQAIAGLRKELDYIVYVDRLPLKPEDPSKHKSKLKKPSRLSKGTPTPERKKRKWWQVFKNLLLPFVHNSD